MLTAFGEVGSFGFYAGLNVVAFVMIFFLMPGKLLTFTLTLVWFLNDARFAFFF